MFRVFVCLPFLSILAVFLHVTSLLLVVGGLSSVPGSVLGSILLTAAIEVLRPAWKRIDADECDCFMHSDR